jgi:predicted transposase YbfD/YdcC
MENPAEPRLFIEHFSEIRDPRLHRTRKHDLIDLLFTAICAVLCGAEDCVAMADFARGRLPWLRQFVKMRGGPPSHDTFSRVFALLDPHHLHDCFVRWTRTIQTVTAGEVVALDGKTLRHSFDTATDRAAIHMVSAWGAANGLVLGQVKVDAKSNEITAIPQLLKMLDIRGCTVTLDAMGTQKEIAKQIIDQKADYVLALKDNHPNLLADVAALFERLQRDRFLDADAEPIFHSRHTTRDADHGRVETRTCLVTDVLGQIPAVSDWAGLRSVVQITRERISGGNASQEIHYYLTSHPADARKVLEAVRSHWRIENSLHWVLDVTFDEDQNRSRLGHGPENLATLRHIALNLCKSNTTRKASVNRKRNMAAWEPDFLTEIITNRKI